MRARIVLVLFFSKTSVAFAKKHAPEKELEIRREIRPIAVELLYEVIGTPKTFEEVLSDMEEQEDDHDK